MVFHGRTLIGTTVGFMHEHGRHARRTMLGLVLIRCWEWSVRSRYCGSCPSGIGTITIVIFTRSAFSNSCALESAFGNNQVSDKRIIVNGTELINRSLGKICGCDRRNASVGFEIKM